MSLKTDFNNRRRHLRRPHLELTGSLPVVSHSAIRIRLRFPNTTVHTSQRLEMSHVVDYSRARILRVSAQHPGTQLLSPWKPSRLQDLVDDLRHRKLPRTLPDPSKDDFSRQRALPPFRGEDLTSPPLLQQCVNISAPAAPRQHPLPTGRRSDDSPSDSLSKRHSSSRVRTPISQSACALSSSAPLRRLLRLPCAHLVSPHVLYVPPALSLSLVLDFPSCY